MSQSTSQPNGDAPVTPTAHEVRGVNLYPHAHLVELRTRGPFAIQDAVTVIPWDVIEGLYSSILPIRLRERGLVVGMVAEAPQLPPGHRQS